MLSSISKVQQHEAKLPFLKSFRKLSERKKVMIRLHKYRLVIAISVLLIFGVVVERSGQIFFMDAPYARLLDTSFKNFTAVQIASFDTSMAKLLVVDLGFRNVQTSRISINRRMLNADRDEVFISELAMKVPENIMATRLFDTTQLKVDYDKLSPVAQTLVAPPFLMDTLTEDKDQQAEVLVIGLGGSQINNFIHHKYPKLNMTVIELEQSMVDIAKEYFGLKVDDTQHVFVMDGIKYLEDAAKQGRKFDAIYIDVCPTRFPEGIMIMCPIPPLLEDEVIRHIRQCLKDTGTMISKMLVFTPQVVQESEKIADKYRKYFANCIVTPMPNRMNRVLVCSGEGIPKERFNLDLMSHKMMDFYEKLGLRRF